MSIVKIGGTKNTLTAIFPGAWPLPELLLLAEATQHYIIDYDPAAPEKPQEVDWNSVCAAVHFHFPHSVKAQETPQSCAQQFNDFTNAFATTYVIYDE